MKNNIKKFVTVFLLVFFSCQIGYTQTKHLVKRIDKYYYDGDKKYHSNRYIMSYKNNEFKSIKFYDYNINDTVLLVKDNDKLLAYEINKKGKKKKSTYYSYILSPSGRVESTCYTEEVDRKIDKDRFIKYIIEHDYFYGDNGKISFIVERFLSLTDKNKLMEEDERDYLRFVFDENSNMKKSGYYAFYWRKEGDIDLDNIELDDRLKYTNYINTTNINIYFMFVCTTSFSNNIVKMISSLVNAKSKFLVKEMPAYTIDYNFNKDGSIDVIKLYKFNEYLEYEYRFFY